jgi:hypothetical protein
MAAAYWLAGRAFTRIEDKWWWVPAAIAAHTIILAIAFMTILQAVE